MGLLSKAKNAISGGGSEPEEDMDIDDMFEEGESIDEPEGNGGVEEEELVEDEDGGEEEQMEWESAYDFAEWWLEDDGFADLQEFGEKAMMMKLQNSPMYRDRIETGVNTLATINEAKQHLQQLKGEGGGANDYGEMADKLEDADRVIQATRSLSGEDEMVVQQGMGLAKSAIEAIGSRVNEGGGNVESSIEREEGRI